MLLSDIIQQVLLDSGEFIVGDISNINLDIGKFWLIAKRALAIYDKYKPVPRQQIITTTDSNYVFPDMFPIPEYISRAYPSGFSYVNPFSIVAFSGGGDWPQIVYRYNKPNFISSFSGQFEIMGHYKREIDITYTDNTNSVISDVDISDIDYDDVYFFDMIEALFMITIGKSRTIFSLPDMPVLTNAPQMIEEGRAKYDEALANIQETATNYYSVGG